MANGKWIIEDSLYGVATCSVCGKPEDKFIHGYGEWSTKGESVFCPNCGARMVDIIYLDDEIDSYYGDDEEGDI